MKNKEITDREIHLVFLLPDLYNPDYWTYDSVGYMYEFINKYSSSLNQGLVDCVLKTKFKIDKGIIPIDYIKIDKGKIYFDNDSFSEWRSSLIQFVVARYVLGDNISFDDITNNVEITTSRIPEECAYQVSVELKKINSDSNEKM